MSQFVTVVILGAVYLSPGPGPVITDSGQGQETDIQELNEGDDGNCPLMEERERARSRIHLSMSGRWLHTCNGIPGWRRVAFINMTDTSYTCPTGLSLTSYSKRTCGRSHTTLGGCSSTTFSIGGLEDKGIPVWSNCCFLGL